MIDAIFIQSWHGEIVSNQLRDYLTHLHEVEAIDIPVWVICDTTSLSDSVYDKIDELIQQFDVQFKFVDDTKYKNPQTAVFYKLVTFRTSQYKQVLLLECDSVLKPGFIKCINADLQKLENWWIYGSCYYGVGAGELLEEDGNLLRRNHLNGIAVYNRTPEYINFVNRVFVNEGGLDHQHAFDWLFAIKFFNSEYKNQKLLYDSDYIINLSPTWDADTPYMNRKPLAKIIHQKITG